MITSSVKVKVTSRRFFHQLVIMNVESGLTLILKCNLSTDVASEAHEAIHSAKLSLCNELTVLHIRLLYGNTSTSPTHRWSQLCLSLCVERSFGRYLAAGTYGKDNKEDSKSKQNFELHFLYSTANVNQLTFIKQTSSRLAV